MLITFKRDEIFDIRLKQLNRNNYTAKKEINPMSVLHSLQEPTHPAGSNWLNLFLIVGFAQNTSALFKVTEASSLVKNRT